MCRSAGRLRSSPNTASPRRCSGEFTARGDLAHHARRSTPMMFSLAIVLVVLAYTWVFDPIAPRWVRHVPTVVVIGLTVWRALKTGEWGLRRSEFLPALRWAAVITGAGVL